MNSKNSKQWMFGIGAIVVALCGYLLYSRKSLPTTGSSPPPDLSHGKTLKVESSDQGGSRIIPSTPPTPTPPRSTGAITLTVGKLTLPLGFTDTAASPKLRQAVAHDLQLIYGHLSGHEVVSVGAFPPVTIQGQPIAPVKLLNFTGSGRHSPAQISREIGYVGNVDGREALLISDKVVAAYREAIERRDSNPAAYVQIDRFVDELNLMGNKPIQDPSELFVIDPAVSKQFDEVGAQAFAQQFAGRKYRAPSLLEIVDGSKVSERYKGRLVAKLYIVTPDGLEDGMPPIIFDKGRWKFLIGNSP